MSRIIAIIGRPNVGKSTLFNRLTQRRDAIVDEESGVTRDRHYGRSDWNGMEFSLIDTGGYVKGSDDVFEGEIRKQVHLAMEEADVLLFMVDVETGITDLDESVARMLRTISKPVVLVVNKVDNTNRLYDANEFYRLGLGEFYTISSINGSGTGELLDKVVTLFDDKHTLEEELILPKITVVGRPNAGKSTLINTLLGEERHIVTPVPGTTRDSIFTRFNKYNHNFYLVDTAGIRKKGKVSENIEFYSVMRSIRAMEYSDVCLLMLDATQGCQAQDINILHIAQKNRKGVVVLVNKWDLIEKDNKTLAEFKKRVQDAMLPFRDVPVLFISALNKQRISKLLDVAMEVYHNRRRRIKTSELNSFMHEAIQQNRPPIYKGKVVRIKYVTQLPTKTPQFAFFCNLPNYVKEPYKRYLENKLREKFNFTGVPIDIYMRKK
jgi:GTP-binding protein